MTTKTKTTLPEMSGTLDEIMSALGVCQDARRVHRSLLRELPNGWTDTMRDNLLLNTVDVEDAFGRLLRHDSDESRRRALRRIWASTDWCDMTTLLGFAQG